MRTLTTTSPGSGTASAARAMRPGIPGERDAGLSLGFRPDLQGLRAIAILLVVLAHAEASLFSGGFIGVDVFFVLSGYLITGLLVRELEQTGRIQFLRFYARRLKRLLPALTLMLLVTAGVAAWLLSGLEARSQLGSAPFAATWTSNLYFTFTALDYFDELAARDLFLHTWSLGVEEQFYLVWPLILAAGFVLAGRRSGGSARGILLAILIGGLLTSLGVALYWSVTAPHAAFYLMPARIWQFALGALVYLGCQPIAEQRGRSAPASRFLPVARLGAWSGLALILASGIMLQPGQSFAGLWVILPSVGAALVIGSGHGRSSQHAGLLAHPALVWLGDRSYSWYLWHWPALMLGFALGVEGQALATLGLVLVSMLAAILSYRLVERPFWKGGLSHVKPRRVLLVSLLVMAASVALLDHGIRALPSGGTVAETTSRWEIDIPIIYHMSCDAWYHHAKVEPCVIGPADASKTVVLLGDSVGAQWFSMVPALFPEPDWRTIVLTKSSCPIVDEDFYYPRIKQIYRICTEWRNAVLDELERIRPDVIIMGNAATYAFTEQQWIEGSARVLRRLSEAADRVLVIPGTPSLDFSGPGCLYRNLSRQGEIDRDACLASGRVEIVAPVARYLKQAARRFHNVEVLDLNDLVCPGDVCSAITPDGQIVFRDSQHLTDSFVQAQIGAIRERIPSATASQR